MQINGFNKTTLLDYPNHLASTIFLGGCNYRCPFCHNAPLVLSPKSIDVISKEEIFNHLKKRTGVIEGVCITGGEPTLQNDLPELTYDIKALGLKVKLDTNGSNPTMLEELMSNNLLDYVAMDIKNSKEKYGITSGIESLDIDAICKSITLIMSSNIDYEFRTTVVKELHRKEDIISMGNWIKGAMAYYLQPYKSSENVIKKGFTSYSDNELEIFKELLNPLITKVEIRGI